MEETTKKKDAAGDKGPELEAAKVALIESWDRIRESVRRGYRLTLQVSGLITQKGEPVGMLFREGPPPVEVLPSDVEEVRELEEITEHLATDLEKFQQVLEP